VPQPDPDVLARIVGDKRREVEEREVECGIARMEERARAAPEPRGFARRIRGCAERDGGAFICEIKQASPSAGLIREGGIDVPAIAEDYERNGAACLSVLTDANFMGELAHLVLARNSCTVPVLRKDFVLGPYQVYESRAAGADAILLLAAVHEAPALRDLAALAAELGMDCLGEAHDEHEMERLIDSGIELVGINNRDLRTFKVSLETTAKLLPLVPEDRVVVSESGIGAPVDVARLRGFGAKGFLVGGSLMSSPRPGAKLAELREGLTPGYLSSARAG